MTDKHWNKTYTLEIFYGHFYFTGILAIVNFSYVDFLNVFPGSFLFFLCPLLTLLDIYRLDGKGLVIYLESRQPDLCVFPAL